MPNPVVLAHRPLRPGARRLFWASTRALGRQLAALLCLLCLCCFLAALTPFGLHSQTASSSNCPRVSDDASFGSGPFAAVPCSSPDSDGGASTTALLADRFSVVINTFRREDLMKGAVEFYAACPGVDTVHVVWCEGSAPPEEERSPGATPVLFHVKQNCSLNNRFHLVPEARTAAIFSVDDDIRVPCRDLDAAFEAWRQQPCALVGFYPRLHRQLPDCSHAYLRTFDTLVREGAYSIVLTKAAFLHRAFLDHYSHGIPAAVRAYVDEHRNCEDIAMQFAAAVATGGSAPPVAVPSASKRDVGAAGLGKQVKGISTAPGHDAMRSRCLDDLSGLFGLGGAVPLATRLVREDPQGWRLQLHAVFGFLLNW